MDVDPTNAFLLGIQHQHTTLTKLPTQHPHTTFFLEKPNIPHNTTVGIQQLYPTLIYSSIETFIEYQFESINHIRLTGRQCATDAIVLQLTKCLHLSTIDLTCNNLNDNSLGYLTVCNE
jgi:hypothetical protein